MASLIPGYEYDIFISYRQKDNKNDGWVTEFVKNLKGELESTFKEEISVYFDINPHDGLLETHDVDASLKEKLRCVVFIPVISQTYCDPKSFAWEHEFRTFVKQSSEDSFGLKLKLPNGNVGSRVLPVQIHDLDKEDKNLIENELGGFIRGIEFIYREPGVNKPLTSSDDEKKNLNGTRYKIQINKVANAVKEIITAIRKQDIHAEEAREEISVLKKTQNISISPGILVGSIIVIAVAVLAYLFFPGLTKSTTPLEKSIAVLPFFNDSPDEENTHLINGIMDEVLNNLQAIKDLRVISRTSVEQYRGEGKPTIPEIARRLDVNYVVEGSGQKYGNTIRLRVQLIEAHSDRHLWAKSYENEIRETKDIFQIQSEVAQAIASELKAIITPEEKKLIEKSATSNLTAYDFYQRGREEHIIYWFNNSNTGSLKKAENLYRKALENDSTFARAYSGLALAYVDKNSYSRTAYFSKNYLDSALLLANRALLYDKELAEAYYARAAYYFFSGNTGMASNEAFEALKYNPNYWEIYRAAGIMFLYDLNNLDFVKGIDCLIKTVSINRGRELPYLMRDLSLAYSWIAGFPEKGKYYNTEALKLDDDSASYFSFLAKDEWLRTNFREAAEYYQKAYSIDSGNREYPFLLGECYMLAGNEKEALKYFKKYDQLLTASGGIRLGGMQYIGYACWKNGLRKEADFYFEEQKKQCEESIRMKRAYATYLNAYFDLAGVYAFRGEKERALANLSVWAKISVCPDWWLILLKNDPLFDSIRNEEGFRQIERDVEAKYQAEHERVRKWLEKSKKL